MRRASINSPTNRRRSRRWDAEVVKQGLLDPKLAARPSARAVSRFFDAISDGGAKPGEAMPFLGGFTDLDEAFTTQRLIANLNLAARRSEPDLLRPASLAEIRIRADRVMSNRSGHDEDTSELVDMLLNQDDALLSRITFDEAREILEEPPASELPQQVSEELGAFKRTLDEPTDEAAVDRYIALAGGLAEPLKARGLARELLDYDAAYHEQVFSTSVRRKLRALLKGKATDR